MTYIYIHVFYISIVL